MTTLSLFLASLAIFQQSGNLNSQKITFSQPAMTLGRLLPKLGEAAGVKMEADKSIKNEVVLIRVKDMPLNDLMSKVAEVSSGSWSKSGESYQLTLSGEKAKAQTIADVSAIVKQIEAYNKMFFNNTSNDEYSQKDRFAKQIFNQIPISELAQIDTMQTVVYAYPALRSQRPLPRAAWEIAQQRLQAWPSKTAGDLEKVFISVTCMQKPMVNAEILFVSTTGKCLDISYQNIGSYSSYPVNLPVTLPQPTAAVELSKDNAELRDRIASATTVSMGSSGGVSSSNEFGTMSASIADVADKYAKKPMGGRLLRFVATPADNEPLAIGSGEALEALAQSQNLDLVACIPDSAINPACRLMTKPITADDLVRNMIANWSLKVAVSQNCMLVMPDKPSQTREFRLNRESLQQLQKHLLSHKPMSLDLLVDYFSTQPVCSLDRNFESAWIYLTAPNAKIEINDNVRRAYKFYGLLGKAQRDALRASGTIPFMSIPPKAKDYFFKNVRAFSQTIRRQTFDQPDYNESYYWKHIDEDFTEVVPDPAMMQAMLVLKRSTRDVLFGITPSGDRVGIDYSAFEIVPTMQYSNQDGTRIVYPVYRFPSYQSGKRIVEYLSIVPRVNQSIFLEYRFGHPYCEDHYDLSGAQMKVTETPKAFQDWVQRNDKHIQDLEQHMSGGNWRQINP